MKVISLLGYLVPIVAIWVLIGSLIYAVLLYRNAPEREAIGFHRYWNVLMMDAYSNSTRAILKFNESEKRSQLFRNFVVFYKISSSIFFALVAVVVFFGD